MALIEMFSPSGRCKVNAKDVDRYKAKYGWSTSPPLGKTPSKPDAPAPVSKKGDAMAEAAAKEVEKEFKSELKAGAPKLKFDKPKSFGKKSDKKQG